MLFSKKKIVVTSRLSVKRKVNKIVNINLTEEANPLQEWGITLLNVTAYRTLECLDRKRSEGPGKEIAKLLPSALIHSVDSGRPNPFSSLNERLSLIVKFL